MANETRPLAAPAHFPPHPVTFPDKEILQMHATERRMLGLPECHLSISCLSKKSRSIKNCPHAIRCMSLKRVLTIKGDL